MLSSLLRVGCHLLLLMFAVVACYYCLLLCDVIPCVFFVIRGVPCVVCCSSFLVRFVDVGCCCSLLSFVVFRVRCSVLVVYI